ncbi:signal peptidase I [Chryseobacterium echinoideorum]|uniref:signal peptidase I n=1 Tax=Chryseobacterium echinoideorum TaxID=1549648 RepID=UPI001186A4F7|nr:signal peptidase I [Chryseobacterium echinoideorum]
MRKKIISAALFLLILIVLRLFFFEIYTINQNSMNNTYKSGDKVLIIKNLYSVDYNDILVFKHFNKKMIKRCVGLPGNTFKIIEGKTYCDDIILPMPNKAINRNISEADAIAKAEIYHTYKKNDWTLYNFGPYLIPKTGTKVSLNSENILLYKKLIENSISDNFKVNENSKENEYIFTSNFYFLIGDNRTESVDSRFFGPVKENDIIGKVILKIW